MHRIGGQGALKQMEAAGSVLNSEHHVAFATGEDNEQNESERGKGIRRGALAGALEPKALGGVLQSCVLGTMARSTMPLGFPEDCSFDYAAYAVRGRIEI